MQQIIQPKKNRMKNSRQNCWAECFEHLQSYLFEINHFEIEFESHVSMSPVIMSYSTTDGALTDNDHL